MNRLPNSGSSSPDDDGVEMVVTVRDVRVPPPASPFASLVVPIDFGRVGDRALRTAAVLARRGGIGVHLATTKSPGIDPGQDEADLAARAAQLGVRKAAIDILESNDVASALSALLEGLPRPLICIGTHGRTALGELLLGSTTNDLLQRSRNPALVVGPRANADDVPTTLSLCVDPCGTPQVAIATTEAWLQTFGGRAEIIEVVEPSASPPALPEQLVRLGAQLGVGVHTIASHDPVQAVVAHAMDHHTLPVVTSHLRRGVGRAVFGSMSWEVIQRCPTPVLVVPLSVD